MLCAKRALVAGGTKAVSHILVLRGRAAVRQIHGPNSTDMLSATSALRLSFRCGRIYAVVESVGVNAGLYVDRHGAGNACKLSGSRVRDDT